MPNLKEILIATALVGMILTGVYAVFSPATPTQAQETVSEPPFSCTMGFLGVSTNCSVLIDELTINEVIFNRGNCKILTEKMAEEELIALGAPRDEVDRLRSGGHIKLDDDLVLQGKANKLGNFKFGDTFILVPKEPCNLLEITLRTDHGDWTWRLPPR
jgi:hypothetical protein